MDPLGTLIVTLGTLVILDIAALQLGTVRRPRDRARGSRRETALELTTAYLPPKARSPSLLPDPLVLTNGADSSTGAVCSCPCRDRWLSRQDDAGRDEGNRARRGSYRHRCPIFPPGGTLHAVRVDLRHIRQSDDLAAT